MQNSNNSAADIYKVVCVAPNLIQIEISDIEAFKLDDKSNFSIGSYLKISDENHLSIIAIVQSYKIKDPSNSDPTTLTSDLSFVIDAQPVGFLDKDGNFKRGRQQIAIPPTNVEIADKETLKKIYKSDEESDSFVFSSLSQDETIPVAVMGDKFFGKHIAVVGSTGSGKSCTVAKILQEGVKPNEKQSKNSILNNSHIVMFDLHGEYSTAFPKANIINVTNLALPYWLMNSEELEEMFVESNERSSHNQISQFRYSVIENKKKHNTEVTKPDYDTPLYFNLSEILNYITNLNNEVIGKLDVDNNKPKLSDGTLVDDRTQKYFENKLSFVTPSTAAATKASNGPFNGDFDRFMMRLQSKMNDERLSFLLKSEKDDGTTYKTDDLGFLLKQFIGYIDKEEANITIIDLSGIPFEVLSVVVSLISRMIFDFCYNFKKLKGKEDEVPILMVYEEAHNYIPQSEGSKYYAVKRSIERIAKEGRKYGISLMIVSQRPSEISETIFSQCNNFVAMRLTNPNDQQYVKRLLPDSVSAITDSLPSLEKREAIIIGDSVMLPTIVKIHEIELKPNSNDINFNTEWKKDWFKVIFESIIKKLKKEESTVTTKNIDKKKKK